MARSVYMYGMGWDRLSDIAIASREAKAGLLVCVLDQSCVSSEPCYVMLCYDYGLQSTQIFLVCCSNQAGEKESGQKGVDGLLCAQISAVPCVVYSVHCTLGCPKIHFIFTFAPLVPFGLKRPQ